MFFKVKTIADVLGISPKTVYHYYYKFAQEDKDMLNKYFALEDKKKYKKILVKEDFLKFYKKQKPSSAEIADLTSKYYDVVFVLEMKGFDTDGAIEFLAEKLAKRLNTDKKKAKRKIEFFSFTKREDFDKFNEVLEEVR